MYIVCSDDGFVRAVAYNPAVPDSTLQDVWKWKREGLGDKDVIDRLRTRTIPAGFPLHKWKHDSK